MKLKDVTHTETFLGEKYIDNFSFCNNRFLLFDKAGNELNPFAMEKLSGVLDLPVLETRTSAYAGYGVGFPTTHIKLDFLDKTGYANCGRMGIRYETDLDTRG